MLQHCTVLLERLNEDDILNKGKKKLKEIEEIFLTDDDSVDEGSDSESKKRTKSDDEDSDGCLDDEDYNLLEENLGFKVQRKKYKRLKRIEESEEELEQELSLEKEAIANELFSNDLRSSDEDKRTEPSHSVRPENDEFGEKNSEKNNEKDSEEEESDTDDFIVHDVVKVIANGRKEKEKTNIKDEALQEAHEVFDVELDYEEDFEEVEEEEDEYSDYKEDIRSPKKYKNIDKKNVKKKSIFDIYDNSELKRGYLTDFDNEIRAKDIPERMQLRATPITSATEEELAEEAQWIYQEVFEHKTISIKDTHLNGEEVERTRKGPQIVAKIQKVLDFMCNQHFEVPFIFFYRKEYILPELDIHDLWKIYKCDARWYVFQQRKKKLLIQFTNFKYLQEDHIEQDPKGQLPDNMRLIEEEDLIQLKTVQTMDELNDYLKQKVRSGPYSICRRVGLDNFAKKFGLSPKHFAKNLSEWYQVHEVKQEPIDPRVIATEYVGQRFQTVDEVLKAVKFMVAYQLAREPFTRESIRKMYREKAMISVQPTKRGIKVIDEHHPIYIMKYLKEKPVTELKGDQYLKLVMAEEDKLITINFSDEIGYTCEYNTDKIKYLYYRDEDSKNVEKWNELRLESVEIALTKMIIPDLKKELHFLLLSEAKDCVMRACTLKMYDWIKIASYSCEYPEESGDEWNTKDGLRVMGLAFVPDFSEAAYACIVAPDGKCKSFLKLPHLLKKKHGINELNKTLKEADMRMVRNFIVAMKPHVIVISGESPEALMIAEDVKDVIVDLVTDEKIPEINIEIVDNELARVYANSHQGASEFGNFPEILRQAISLARRLQDPLVEFSQLCNVDNEILCLNFHSLQKQLPKEELLENIYLEFVNRVNEVGVDLNKIIRRSHAANLIQFICGLGPRKGRHLVKTVKQLAKQRLENRKQLVTSCQIGRKVLVNCAAFIKIDNNNLDDSTETEIEFLDGTRIHPEMYKLAKRMAMDVLEYDREHINTSDALEEILNAPERLNELDLDAFAKKLEERGYRNLSVTLNNIRSELINRYKDLRVPYQQPSPEDLLYILIKETPETFCIGKLVEATIIGVHYRKTKADQLEQEHPIRHDETSLWQCPLCLKHEFLELPEVWSHLDSDDCPGKAIGIRLRLDNGMYGYIRTENLSDEVIVNPIERACIGNRINCRVIKIDVDLFSVEATSKNSDLADVKQEWRPLKDPHYDTEAEEKDNLAEKAKKTRQKSTYVPRSIIHPSFRNITHAQAEMMLQTMPPGEAIIRPSSEGEDHLRATWKVTDGIYQHVDIREEGKVNKHSLGQSLWIGNNEYEDLDELLSRHIYPMTSYAAELLEFKYYKASVMGVKIRAEEILEEQKREKPDEIPYIVSASKNYPGNFLLSYLPGTMCHHEYITISQNGFKFRQNHFDRVRELFDWFKKQFMNLILAKDVKQGKQRREIQIIKTYLGD